MNKRIVIYGAGRIGKHVLKFFKKQGMTDIVEAFCDKNSHDIRCIEGIPVFSFEEKEWGEETVFLIAVKEGLQKEIANMLKSHQKRFFNNLEEWLQVYYHEDLYTHEKEHLLKEWREELTWKLDDSNNLLKCAYENDNYIEKIINPEKDICYIFFSGNGLYFPNEKWVFEDVVLESNRYEWTEISKSECLTNIAGKYIFVRDIFKSWYVKGINSRIDSIGKLINFLKKETIEKGYRVRTVGNSAGGYMAALVGALINAEIVFDFSGQFSLYKHNDVLDSYYFLDKYKNDAERNCFYDIIPYIQGEVPIMYFFPYYCSFDMVQSNLIRNINNMYAFSFDEKIHGSSMKNKDIPVVLQLEKEKLMTLFYKYRNKLINAEKWGNEIESYSKRR